MSKRNEISFKDCLESDAFKLICKSYCEGSKESLIKLINLGIGAEDIYALSFGLMKATNMKDANGKLFSDELLENGEFKRSVGNAIRINQASPITSYMLAVVDYAKANSEFVEKNEGKGSLLENFKGKNTAIAEVMDLQEQIDEAIENKRFDKVVELKSVLFLKKGKQLALDALVQPYSQVENTLFNVSLGFAVGSADSRSLGLQVVNEGMNNLLMSSLGYTDVSQTTVGRLETSYKLTGNWKYKAVETLLLGDYFEQSQEDRNDMDILSVYADKVIAFGAQKFNDAGKAEKADESSAMGE